MTRHVKKCMRHSEYPEKLLHKNNVVYNTDYIKFVESIRCCTSRMLAIMVSHNLKTMFYTFALHHRGALIDKISIDFGGRDGCI